MTDPRRSQLAAWAASQTGESEVELAPVSSDAGFRRYFRFSTGEQSLIAMDAPSEREDIVAFVHNAELLRAAGVHAPAVIACEPRAGFLLLEDLGDRSFLDALDEHNADQLFNDAIEALITMQAIDAADLPLFDQALLRRESNLFPEWYLRRHLRLNITPGLRHDLEAVFTRLEAAALAQPTVFVHRDFMPRNLMRSVPSPGVIDFQDAIRGPVTYDIVCLFKDAFISWPEAKVDQWLRSYWSKARTAGIPVQDNYEEFKGAADWMGIQRHLKVIGIFARLCYRDGKCHYLKDTPRFFNYIFAAAERYPELNSFVSLLRQWQVAASSSASVE